MGFNSEFKGLITYHAVVLGTDCGVLLIAGHIFNTLRKVLYNKKRNKLTN